MPLLCVRASDGAAFYLTPEDLQSVSTLDQLRNTILSPLLEIAPECIICMNEEGAQLRDDSVSVLALRAASPSPSTSTSNVALSASNLKRSKHEAGPREYRIYVFDRAHLDEDPEVVAQALAITEEQILDEAELHAQDPLTSHVALSTHYLETLRALIHSISLQHASLALALSNLTRVNTGSATSLAVYRETSSPSIESWSKLLLGWEACMAAIAKVSVVSGLVSKGAGSGAGHTREGSTITPVEKEKDRYLGDYVSPEKMTAVRDGCAKVLDDLKSREAALQGVLDGVTSGTAEVAAVFTSTSHDLEDLELCETDAVQGHLRIEELVRTGSDLTDPDLLAECFEELTTIDAETRDRLRFLVTRKNAMTRYFLHEMQRISNLQSDIASMPSNLGALDLDLRTKTENFKYIARLEGLIPAYVATVVEVVRRREYARLLAEHSISLESPLLPLSTTESTRRKNYRVKYAGPLPWEVRGLGAGSDNVIPMIDFGLKNGSDELPDLQREAVQDLQRSFVELEAGLEDQAEDNPIRKGRRLADELSAELSVLDHDFEALAQARAEITPHHPPSDSDAPSLEALRQQVRDLEEGREELARELQSERTGREEELAQLNLLNGQLSAQRDRDTLAVSRLQSQLEELQQASSRADGERKSWDRERNEWTRERREAKSLFDEVVKRANQSSMDARQATTRSSEVERQLETSRSVADDLARQLEHVEGQHRTLRSDHDGVQSELQRARSNVHDLESQIRSAEATLRELNASAAEKERLLRDEKAEVQAAHAILDKELQDLRQSIAVKDADVALSTSRIATLEEIATGLREQIARWELVASSKESEVWNSKQEVDAARREKEEGIVGAQRELVVATRVARSALAVAGTLRDDNTRLAALLLAPAPSKSDSSSDNAEQSLARQASRSPADSAHEPPQRDYAAGDLEELLTDIQQYDPNSLPEAVKTKVETLTAITKKWSKEAKAYRERAHRAASTSSDKIAFRHFAKGDLALFLPTRNTTVPVWAAFNVSFPHHFLAATGVISEQMKSREWIVARITSLTEKVVDAKDPSSNPYGLAAGTKFFLLEVEPWSSKEGSSRSRKHSSAEKRTSRPEERRTVSSGHIRESRSEGGSLPGQPVSFTATTPPTAAPSFRRVASTPGLPSNATDLARSEFAIVEEDEVLSRPPSPQTLKQPVPESEEPFSASTPASPSALTRALARANTSEVSQTAATEPRKDHARISSDPFARGPFQSSSPDPVAVTPPATDFEPTITPAGAAPAFLSSRSSAGSGRVRRVSSSKPKLELGSSPTSTSGSFVTPRSASSGSSILSASILRKAGSAFPGSSPPVGKAQATQEAQDSSSRWPSLTQNLSTATRDGLPGRTAMTIGRNSKGWPASSGASLDASKSKRSSVLDNFMARPAPPQPTGSLAASVISKALGSSSTPPPPK